MNRLVIIGNGFDLAHQMKTSYYDFLLSYIKESFLTAINHSSYEDKLLEIKVLKNVQDIFHLIDHIKNIQDIKEFKKYLDPNDEKLYYFSDDTRINSNEIFRWKIKSKFIKQLFLFCYDNRWVDIENRYYEELKETLSYNDKTKKLNALNLLNDSFKFLIELLEKYLQKQKPLKLDYEYLRIFSEKIIKDEIVSVKLKTDELPKSFIILNFNHTTTIEDYSKETIMFNQNIQWEKTIHIHGQVNNSDNPIIFGFGDELDKDFEIIENEKIKGFLDYIKSFMYFKTSNYHDLIRFIESDDFQVYILGHSCGLSDRTMLNMIFEHQNCKSIKIFYYSTNDKNNHFELTQEISRHFKDKGSMRKKIIPVNKSREMPQIKL